MELLEEVRDRFSQARGFIDFVLTQLLGNPARGIPPFLEEPWGRLLGPDRIVDHFADLFEVQPEFLPIAQKLFPYFRKRIPDCFENKVQQELAWRLLKLLVLVHLSPVRKRLDAQEAVQWLLVKVSTLQPEKNLDVVRRVLDTLTREGAYLKKDASHYRLDLEDDSQQILEQLLAKAVAELQGRGDALFESLIPCLDREEFNPFVLPRDRWQSRKVLWHFHEREIQVWLGGGVTEGPEGLGLQIGLPWGPPPESLNGYRVVPKPIELTQEILELAALLQLKSRPLPPKILERIGERIASRRVWFCRLVQAAYLEASLVLPLGQVVASPLGRQPRPLQAWLNGLGEWMLRQTYPMFERFAPAHGPLPREAYRQFMQFANEDDWARGQAPEFVQLIQEAYLAPMGLLQRRGSEYVAHSRLDQHELVRLLAPLLDHHPSPKQVHEHLAAPVYGLVPDQVNLLLLTLLLQGDIDLLKGNRSYRDHYETLISPLQYDAVVPGHGLNALQLRELQLLCDGFDIKGPKQWSVSAQKRAITQLKGIGRSHREALGGFLAKLKELGRRRVWPNKSRSASISGWLWRKANMSCKVSNSSCSRSSRPAASQSRPASSQRCLVVSKACCAKSSATGTCSALPVSPSVRTKNWRTVWRGLASPHRSPKVKGSRAGWPWPNASTRIINSGTARSMTAGGSRSPRMRSGRINGRRSRQAGTCHWTP